MLSPQAYLGGEAMYVTEQSHTIGLPLEATIGVVKGLFVGWLSEQPASIVKVQSIADNHASLVKVSPINPGLSLADEKSVLVRASTPKAEVSCGLPNAEHPSQSGVRSADARQLKCLICRSRSQTSGGPHQFWWI